LARFLFVCAEPVKDLPADPIGKTSVGGAPTEANAVSLSSFLQIAER
jgi:hypothetical protein